VYTIKLCLIPSVHFDAKRHAQDDDRNTEILDPHSPRARTHAQPACAATIYSSLGSKRPRIPHGIHRLGFLESISPSWSFLLFLHASTCVVVAVAVAVAQFAWKLIFFRDKLYKLFQNLTLGNSESRKISAGALRPGDSPHSYDTISPSCRCIYE
jgi:hypothetical protein